MFIFDLWRSHLLCGEQQYGNNVLEQHPNLSPVASSAENPVGQSSGLLAHCLSDIGCSQSVPTSEMKFLWSVQRDMAKFQGPNIQLKKTLKSSKNLFIAHNIIDENKVLLSIKHWFWFGKTLLTSTFLREDTQYMLIIVNCTHILNIQFERFDSLKMSFGFIFTVGYKWSWSFRKEKYIAHILNNELWPLIFDKSIVTTFLCMCVYF